MRKSIRIVDTDGIIEVFVDGVSSPIEFLGLIEYAKGLAIQHGSNPIPQPPSETELKREEPMPPIPQREGQERKL